MINYFGFAIADSMFESVELIRRTKVSIQEIKELTSLVPVINPSHQATISAMNIKFAIQMAIPETPPKVELKPGDCIFVMGVRGLPRLTDRHEYTEEEISKASWNFSKYTILS